MAPGVELLSFEVVWLFEKGPLTLAYARGTSWFLALGSCQSELAGARLTLLGRRYRAEGQPQVEVERLGWAA